MTINVLALTREGIGFSPVSIATDGFITIGDPGVGLTILCPPRVTWVNRIPDIENLDRHPTHTEFNYVPFIIPRDYLLTLTWRYNTPTLTMLLCAPIVSSVDYSELPVTSIEYHANLASISTIPNVTSRDRMVLLTSVDIDPLGHGACN